MIPDPDSTNHLTYASRRFNMSFTPTEKFDAYLNSMAQTGWQLEKIVMIDEDICLVVFSGLIGEAAMPNVAQAETEGK